MVGLGTRDAPRQPRCHHQQQRREDSNAGHCPCRHVVGQQRVRVAAAGGMAVPCRCCGLQKQSGGTEPAVGMAGPQPSGLNIASLPSSHRQYSMSLVWPTYSGRRKGSQRSEAASTSSSSTRPAYWAAWPRTSWPQVGGATPRCMPGSDEAAGGRTMDSHHLALHAPHRRPSTGQANGQSHHFQPHSTVGLHGRSVCVLQPGQDEAPAVQVPASVAGGAGGRRHTGTAAAGPAPLNLREPIRGSWE